MKHNLQIVCISHLSDIQDIIRQPNLTTRRKDIIFHKSNFIKFLLDKYDTQENLQSTWIDTEEAFRLFTQEYPESDLG